MLKLSQIAGFNFEKKAVLIKTKKMYFDIECKRYKPAYEIQPLSEDEMQAIFDAWQKQKSINEEYGFNSGSKT